MILEITEIDTETGFANTNLVLCQTQNCQSSRPAAGRHHQHETVQSNQGEALQIEETKDSKKKVNRGLEMMAAGGPLTGGSIHVEKLSKSKPPELSGSENMYLFNAKFP